MNIVLVGMPGTGKTTIGELLAKKTGAEFYDADSLIEKLQSMCIAEIFKTKGEKYFRKIESDIIRNIPSDNTVVSLGGGAFENSDTRDFLLSGNNTVIYLKTSAQKIYERIKNDTTRPLLTDNMNIETIQNMLNIREKNYKLAHYTVLTDNRSADEIVNEILGK